MESLVRFTFQFCQLDAVNDRNADGADEQQQDDPHDQGIVNGCLEKPEVDDRITNEEDQCICQDCQNPHFRRPQTDVRDAEDPADVSVEISQNRDQQIADAG